MQRLIKFRAWYTKTNQMRKVHNLNFTNQGWLSTANLVGGGTVEPAKLMQYTGLKDKNGVEIYEGDIIKTAYRSTVAGEYDGQYMGTVEFSEAAFNITWYGNDPDASFYELWFKNRLEVIGNIMENPELLQ